MSPLSNFFLTKPSLLKSKHCFYAICSSPNCSRHHYIIELVKILGSSIFYMFPLILISFIQYLRRQDIIRNRTLREIVVKQILEAWQVCKSIPKKHLEGLNAVKMLITYLTLAVKTILHYSLVIYLVLKGFNIFLVA